MSQPTIPDRQSSLDHTIPAGPAIPIRSSSKRKPSAALSAAPSSGELARVRDEAVKEIKKRRKELKPSSSYDSDFWSSKADLIMLDHERVELHRMVEFHEYKENGGTLSYSDWENSMATALELRRESHALKQQEAIARYQAERLKETTFSKNFRQTFVKLFNSSKIGFNISTTGQGRRPTKNQSKMRSSMLRDYCNGNKAGAWEPVFGMWMDVRLVTAAHLFPWRSADTMDQIFGEGAVNEMFSSLNGLFLDPAVESALDKGYLVIVPDQDIEPQEPSSPEIDQEARHQRLKEWERSNPKEYKVVVLDPKPAIMQTIIFDKENNGYPVEKLVELHGRRLKFLNDFRPRSRYVWWTYLNALTQISWREKSSLNTAIQLEVSKGTRYWGTHGRYVKKNQLLGFVEQIGHDVKSITDSIMEHAIEEDDDVANEPDMSGIAVISDEIVHRAQENDGYDYDDSEGEEDYSEDKEGDSEDEED
jgi:HNH endonuclease